MIVFLINFTYDIAKCINRTHTLNTLYNFKGGELMIVSIDAKSPLSIWEQIVFHTKENIAKGILSKGEKLPSVRELATTLVINPNTVSRAYQELERQGIIETVRGKGTFVSEEYHPAPSTETIDKLKIRLHSLLSDCSIEGIKKETIYQWIDSYFIDGKEKKDVKN